MHCVRRSGAAALRTARLQSRRQQPRRLAHDSHGAHDAHHAAPVNESFSTGFYTAIGSVAAGVFIYSYMASGSESFVTKAIRVYTERHDTWETRNALHTKAIEEAAADKALFNNSATSTHVELKFPEVFNTGAPWNVPAGQGSINLDKVIAHYEQKNYKEQAEKLEALKNGTLKAEQPAKPRSSHYNA